MDRLEAADTYRYYVLDKGKILHGGCTSNLGRRLGEVRERFPEAILEEVGSKVTRLEALEWLEEVSLKDYPSEVVNPYLKIPGPEGIDISGHLCNTFGSYEGECSARYIVSYCQIVGSWAPFTLEGLDLATPGSILKLPWIEQRGDLYYVTLRFLAQLYPYWRCPNLDLNPGPNQERGL